MKLQRVTSLYDLYNKANTNPYYAQLAIIAANNLGGEIKTLSDAKKWLNLNASETDESDVVEEINFCRDLVKE